jgi:hypothetical protein
MKARSFSLLTAALVFLIPAAHLTAADATPPRGVKLVTAAHSFHNWMPPILSELAQGAGIQGHEQLQVEMIGGSQIIQHWNLPDDKSKVKPVLLSGKADVLTLSPIYLPDQGIENFVKLGLEHNPKLRVTLQEFWMPFELRGRWETRAKGEVIDRDSMTMEQLRAAHAEYFKNMDAHVRSLNEQLGHTVISVVPVGQAVLALREKIIAGAAPGVEKQSALFTDAIGHCNSEIKALAAFCHFGVIYARSPVGLATPTILKGHAEAEALSALLQNLAWEAVTSHPLSGVKK